VIDDEPVGIYGFLANARVIWMVATERLRERPLQFIREARETLGRWAVSARGPLWNFVDSRNALHIRWLKWMGAVFSGNKAHFHDPTVLFLEFFIPCVSPH
jgi:hypothetical protein